MTVETRSINLLMKYENEIIVERKKALKCKVV